MIIGRMDRSKLNDRFSRGLSWVVALLSIGAILWIDCPTHGADVAARNEASLPGLEDVEAAPAAARAAILVGIEEQAAVGLLGAPTATESRAPADIWRYTTSRCELELVFYMEMRTGRMRSLHHAFKGEVETPAQRQACLTAIQENSFGGEEAQPESKVAVELLSEKGGVPVSQPSLQPTRYMARNRAAHGRRYVRRYDSRPVRNARRGYMLALRYPHLSGARMSRGGFTPNYAAATSGWGGGLFGPAPYSMSGPQ